MSTIVSEQEISIQSLRQKCNALLLSPMKCTGSDSFILVNKPENSKLAEILDTSTAFSDIELKSIEADE
jgi:hypothetical protein